MAEVMLALGRNQLKSYIGLDRADVADTYGVKIIPNELYSFSSDVDPDGVFNYTAVAAVARKFGAKRIVIDERISSDVGDDFFGVVDEIVERVSNPPLSKKRTAEHRRPDFISASVDITQKAMKSFKDATSERKVQPVVHLTSSRFTDVDFDNRGTTAEKNAVWRAKLAMNLGYVSGAVICAAADAEVIKNVNPNFITFVTGAMLADNVEVDPLELRHERPAIIEATSEFVDVFIIGSPIFYAGAPEAALRHRIDAARA